MGYSHQNKVLHGNLTESTWCGGGGGGGVCVCGGGVLTLYLRTGDPTPYTMKCIISR